MKYLLIILLAVTGWLLVDQKIEIAHSEGFKLGMHYALKKDPPSEELELTCAALWVGEQNKNYFERQKK